MEVATYKRDGDGLWVAHVVDHEGEGPRGEGATEICALCELARELWDNHDVALFDCLAAIMRHDADAEEANTELGAAHGLRIAARTIEGIV